MHQGWSSHPGEKGIIVNQEWKNEHFNVIINNEALAIEIELQNGDKIILATIYCPNGNPSLRLFKMINALLRQVIFLGDFNSKHKQFACVKPKGKKNLRSTPLDYSVEYFWTAFGSLLEYPSESHFDDCSLVFLWSTFGPLLEYPITVDDCSFVFITQSACCEPCTINKKLHAEPSLPIMNYCIVQLLVM